MSKYEQEKLTLSQLYNNNADVVKFLPYFFKNPKDLQRFLYYFGGKTLVVPETYGDFIKYFLNETEIPGSKRRQGINSYNHSKIKHKILETYIRLFNSNEEVIRNECNNSK